VLRAQAQTGKIRLTYFDEAGFAQVHPNRSAWTVCGEQHCTQAPRGERLNVMAALFSDGSVIHSSCWCSTTAELFLGFVTELAKTVTKTLVILIDNAAIHRARAIQPALRLLEKKGLTLKFLPPYSPELNRIEKLWWLMKHRWMALTRRTKVELEQTVNHILANFDKSPRRSFSLHSSPLHNSA
jgi:transposase